MGKPTGFMEYDRQANESLPVKERIGNFREFHLPLPMAERQKQGARCMECGVPFCQSGMILGGMASGCPLNNLIPEWNDLLYTGNYAEALIRLRKTNNFPEFTSRVCPAPCEAACTCGVHDAPVTIKENENGIVEYGYENDLMGPNPPKVRSDKRVAVVGSGPAGLAAADQLNQRGHCVTVFERADKAGGLLMYGIPNMKLEKQIIQRKVDILQKEGITFITGTDIGGKVPAEEITKYFDAVILACGAANPRDIQVPGRELPGIYFAVDFLTAVTKSLLSSNLEDKKYPNPKGKHVVVIGGGDTGNDCVGTVIRLGCRSMTQLEMMPKLPDVRTEQNPWPQWPKVCKVDYGQEEAIALFGQDPRIYQTTVKEFLPDKHGKVKQAVIVDLIPKKDPASGRISMIPVEGSEREIKADLVLIAAGFLGAQAYVADAFGVKLNTRTNVETAPGSYETNVPGIFTAGDMHRGQSLVVWAIREGREAARAVDRYLTGY